MARLVLVFLMFIIIIGVPASLVWVWQAQNAHQTARLGLDLAALGAWEMSAPVAVPALMGGSFGVGVLCGILLVGMLSITRRLKRRRAETPVENDTFTSVA